MENIYDVISWGTVTTVQGKEFFLLAPKPYHSEMSDDKVSHSIWQPENTLKWEVADVEHYTTHITDEIEEGNRIYVRVYNRSIIIFSSNSSLIQFHQDPKTIKVKYITPDGDDEVSVNPI